MLDTYVNKVIIWPLKWTATLCDKCGIKADGITITSFVIGLLVIPALYFQLYQIALGLILVNRFFDGLDGALARQQGVTDAGGFLDISLDFTFYALVPFGFILANPQENAFAGAFLLVTFIASGSAFLAFASIASSRGIENPSYPKKTLCYLGGMIEGTETLVFFILFCLFPQHFPLLAWILGVLCIISSIIRTLFGYRTLKN